MAPSSAKNCVNWKGSKPHIFTVGGKFLTGNTGCLNRCRASDRKPSDAGGAFASGELAKDASLPAESVRRLLAAAPHRLRQPRLHAPNEAFPANRKETRAKPLARVRRHQLDALHFLTDRLDFTRSCLAEAPQPANPPGFIKLGHGQCLRMRFWRENRAPTRGSDAIAT